MAYLVEVVVLANELLQLRLHIDNLGGRELELHDRHACILEVLQETNLGRLEEHQTATLAFGTTGGTSDTVNVVARIIRRIELDNPIDSGDLEFLVSYGISVVMRVGKHTSKPRAATSVQIKVPCLALQNSKKVLVRFCCFCFPCNSRTGRSM